MSAVRRFASRRHHAPSRDRWLVSYADFITLMFAFFATLYAISSVDAQKRTALARGMEAAFDDRAPKKVSGRGVLPEHSALGRAGMCLPRPPVTSTDENEGLFDGRVRALLTLDA